MKIPNRIFPIITFLSLWYACTQEQAIPTNTQQIADLQPVLPEQIDFNFHVKPILSDKCFKCHGPDKNKQEANLAFHEKELAFKSLDEEGETFAIVPGDVENSLLIKYIHSTDPNEQMPPPTSNLVLSEYEKKILEKWIVQGAVWKQHWAFLPPENVPIPGTKNDWPINDIDHFILEKLDKEGFQPAPETEKTSLYRRASFTLTGLPPTIEKLDELLADQSEYTYENYIDELLASKAYAERMTQIWMDLARYADSHGYQDDPQRFMWPWRDWVIHAYDQNMPYDQFVKWQLAGDMLPDASLEQTIASGFNRNHKITYEGGSIPEEFRTEYVADRAQTFGIAFLGLTVECARCHDHKYDPISQKNYFELFAFFNNVPEKGFIEPIGVTPEPFITLSKEDMAAQASFIQNLDSIETLELMVMQEAPKSRKTYILNRGQYDQPTEEIKAGTPISVLDFEDRPKNRIGLADWLFNEENPLTSRVAVNRLWQQVFGTGIVASSYDFGNQGSLPTHPDLLDHLAKKFQVEGWNTKAMLKYMVLSATFRQSAKISPEELQSDPENRLLARATRIRLDGEMVRDQILLASGLLNPQFGGPPVKPYQPEGLWAETIGGGGDLRVYVQDEGSKLYRRSLYTFWKRTSPPPGMMTFDGSARDVCIIKRQETNTPLQALVLMNDPQVIEAARVLALQALSQSELSLKEQINFIFRKATSRNASDKELASLVAYYEEEYQAFAKNKSNAESYLSIGEKRIETDISPIVLAAFSLVTNAIFNLDEAICRG